MLVTTATIGCRWAGAYVSFRTFLELLEPGGGIDVGYEVDGVPAGVPCRLGAIDGREVTSALELIEPLAIFDDFEPPSDGGVVTGMLLRRSPYLLGDKVGCELDLEVFKVFVFLPDFDPGGGVGAWEVGDEVKLALC